MSGNKGIRLIERGGFFYIAWSGNTRGVSTKTRDRQAAEKALAEFILNLSPAAQPKALDFNWLLDDYEAEHVDASVVDPDGVRRSKVADPAGEKIRIGHLRAFFGPIDISDVTQDHVEEYVGKRVTGEVGRPSPSPHTHRREMALLMAALAHHMRKPPKHRRITHDECPKLRLPATGDARMIWLEMDEIDALLLGCFDKEFDTLDEALAATKTLPRVFRFVAIGVETGARPGAILDLEWSRIDLEGGLIHYHIDGRRRTRKRRPIVPISDLLRPILLRARSEGAGATHVVGTGSIRTAWETACKRAAARLYAQKKGRAAAKLLNDFTPHCLRHTFATQALRHGVDIWHVAGMLGDTTETVEKTYGHHAPGYLKGAANWRGEAQKASAGEIDTVDEPASKAEKIGADVA